MAKDNDIIRWITWNGRRIPIKKGMNGKFDKKLIEEEKEKRKAKSEEKSTEKDTERKKDHTFEMNEEEKRKYEEVGKKIDNLTKEIEEKNKKQEYGHAYDVGYYTNEEMHNGKSYVHHETKDGLQIGDGNKEGIEKNATGEVIYNMSDEREKNLTPKEKVALRNITNNNKEIEKLTQDNTDIYNTKTSRKEWFGEHRGEATNHVHETKGIEEYHKELSSKDKVRIKANEDKIEALRKDSLKQAEVLKENEGKYPIKNTKVEKLSDEEKYKLYKEAKKENIKERENAKKTGQEYRNKLNKISDKSIPDGTYDVDTGKTVDFKNEGYNVSFEQSGVKLTDSEYYDNIEYCKKKCDGKVYAGKFGGDPEISFYTKDKKTAMELMEKYNQHSIWDNSIGDIIENPKYDGSKNKVNYKSNDIVNDDNKTIKYSFRVGDRNIFEINYHRVGNNKEMYFSTSSNELNKRRTDIIRGGQAQKDLLKPNTTARNFYEKWDKKHLSALTQSEYNDLINDIEKLKSKYPYVESDSFYQQAELDKRTKIRRTKSLSEIQQYYLSLGYSNATALKMAKQDIKERKKR